MNPIVLDRYVLKKIQKSFLRSFVNTYPEAVACTNGFRPYGFRQNGLITIEFRPSVFASLF
jgi:hypothetical protein